MIDTNSQPLVSGDTHGQPRTGHTGGVYRRLALYKVIGLLMVLLSNVPSRAQTVAPLRADTVIFTAAEFFGAVMQYHPLVRQAALFPEEARADIMQARGAFDPKLSATYDRKQFGPQTNGDPLSSVYYNKWGSELSVPIAPLGTDVKVTYDRAFGAKLNPEATTPATGLLGVGVNVPIGQTLLIDARRNALRQARLGVNLADADRLKNINKTLFDAAKAYWEWYLSYRSYRLIDEGLQLADVRFQGTRLRALVGEVATIDTTEALITLQDRLVQRQQAEVDLQNARLRLSAFLWAANEQPVDLPANVIPQTAPTNALANETVQNLLDQALRQHPELLKLTAKTEQLRFEERFRRALIQPQVNLSAALLSQTPTLLGTSVDRLPTYYAFGPENYKIGLDVVFPLFLRKERGKLKQVQLKGQQLVLERQQTERDIQNDILAARNELQTLARQVTVQEQTFINQRRLVQAEQQKFSLGESSLFLVNSRESKLIDLGVKLEELRTKYQKALANLWYVAGTNQMP
ncbi:TolC family protein [Fibrella musci]|uniref:TolC family protein n=1 Tax=Fibrella musci TaxID=3242485 RepID=UPI0035215780